MSDIKNNKQTAAELLVRSLVQQNVKHIFGIPGGKIMPTFDVLRDEGPRLIVCRHEQNAAFMAAAVGRLTGRPGVCLVIPWWRSAALFLCRTPSSRLTNQWTRWQS